MSGHLIYTQDNDELYPKTQSGAILITIRPYVSGPPCASLNVTDPACATQTAQLGLTACQDARHVQGWNTRWGVTRAHANSRIGAKHAGGGNFTFADGHVKWFKAPPSDCSMWSPRMTVGTSIFNTTACRPSGQPATWCD